MSQTQISAYISPETREQVERFVKAHGLKKGHLVEQALLHHLQALTELPAEYIIPPRLLVPADAMKEIADRLDAPGKPTRTMETLMAGPFDDD